MRFRPAYTALAIFFFVFQTTCVPIRVRSLQIPGLEAIGQNVQSVLRTTAGTPRAEARREHGRESTIDWREDGILRRESEREAGFPPGSLGA
ncbi:uncharacterized protein N7515_008264 [Penicillium bovifimosum]|uniref:Uncharacterized protein n=1 Tax=Penicillium bovifimosum TaxID=126998 RepID=A0A9W9GN35_9EURO|nr:uncharacterized protein N7515_008264 [Penicillium bovifimosum]KAJ5124439.1 hypothetical protein N7515_008264 [Penicillium bovifimosum]